MTDNDTTASDTTTRDTTTRDDAPAATAKHAGERREAAGRDEASVIGRTVTINRPRSEVYAFWRDFTNLPKVMENVASITAGDATR